MGTFSTKPSRLPVQHLFAYLSLPPVMTSYAIMTYCITLIRNWSIELLKNPMPQQLKEEENGTKAVLLSGSIDKLTT